MKQANALQINEEHAMFKITVIFDGIAVVNKTKLEPALQNCCLLEKVVLRIVLCETGDAFEIRVVSDRYLEFWLKQNVQEKCRQGLEVMEYEVADNALPWLIVVAS